MEQNERENEDFSYTDNELYDRKDESNFSDDEQNDELEQNIDCSEESHDEIEEEILEEMESKGVYSWIIDLFEWVETLVMAVVCVILLFTFVARTSQVSGESMVPTLQDKDMLMVSRVLFDPTYGDIVVVTKPNYLNEPLIKRVIATEGQQVNIDFEQGIVYVNNIALEEPYVNAPTNVKFDINFPVTVPKGQLFVMGDNRNRSLDSRSSDIGMIDERYILGKAFLRFAPFDSFGGLYS